jgi:sulfur-carrier protein
MAVQVLVPTPLRKFTNNEETVTVAPGTIASIVDDLEAQFPGIKARLTDDSGELRRFVNIYVNEEDIRFLSGKETPVADGDAISIVPAIAGGAR